MFLTCSLFIAEKMQKAQEASMRCLQSKALPYTPQFNTSFVEGVPEVKDEICTESRGGIIERDSSLSQKSFAPSNEGYHGPIHLQDYYLWSTSHPYIQKAHHNQFHMLGSHFYPMNHNSFSMDNQFHYVPNVPLKMLPHRHPHNFHFQEFQYFVVIDFEATCDKEKNPYPQEIIEFPSVLVNSMTGQLEDSFQIYVRPTCNHLLSDFCKELTGIQQIQVCLECEYHSFSFVFYLK